jgi:hypothetical protein
MFFHQQLMKEPAIRQSPRIVMCATPWSLEYHSTPARRWPLERQIEAIADAGFDGVSAAATADLVPHLQRYGLAIMGRIDTGTIRGVRERLAAQRAAGARLINVQLADHDTPPSTAARLAVALVRQARREGVSLHIETHRDTATETPEKYEEIARLYRQATDEWLPTTWDHSHFAVSKHLLAPDFGPRLLLRYRSLIQRSQIVHCRPFNSQHCQVPVTNGRGRLTPEFQEYLAFAEELFLLWLQGPRPGGELWVCPELGTSVGYHVSTNPPVWPDTVRCRKELLGAWRRALIRCAPEEQPNGA